MIDDGFYGGHCSLVDVGFLWLRTVAFMMVN